MGYTVVCIDGLRGGGVAVDVCVSEVPITVWKRSKETHNHNPMMQKPMRPNRWPDWKAPQRFHIVPNIHRDEVHLHALPVSRFTGWRAHELTHDKKGPVNIFFLQNKRPVLLRLHAPSFGFKCHYNAKFMQQSPTDTRFLRLIFIFVTAYWAIVEDIFNKDVT